MSQVDEATQKSMRRERLARLGGRLKTLQEAGYFDHQDVEGIREMVKNGIVLSQVEFFVQSAEEGYRETRTVTPVPAYQKGSA